MNPENVLAWVMVVFAILFLSVCLIAMAVSLYQLLKGGR
jgi:hypothetical protein